LLKRRASGDAGRGPCSAGSVSMSGPS
jgi:hypothetical protein